MFSQLSTVRVSTRKGRAQNVPALRRYRLFWVNLASHALAPVVTFNGRRSARLGSDRQSPIRGVCSKVL